MVWMIAAPYLTVGIGLATGFWLLDRECGQWKRAGITATLVVAWLPLAMWYTARYGRD